MEKKEKTPWLWRHVNFPLLSPKSFIKETKNQNIPKGKRKKGWKGSREEEEGEEWRGGVRRERQKEVNFYYIVLIRERHAILK